RAGRHVRRHLRPAARDQMGRGARVTGTAERHPERFINRELSWLAFNERVLEEASDATNPLLERVKFAAIVASNLDEFFMVRVAGLRHSVAEGNNSPDSAGLRPSEQLVAVADRAHTLVDSLYSVTAELLSALEPAGLRIVPWEALTRPQKSSLSSYFRHSVLPVLTPLATDASRPFPLLSSLSLN